MGVTAYKQQRLFCAKKAIKKRFKCGLERDDCCLLSLAHYLFFTLSGLSDTLKNT